MLDPARLEDHVLRELHVAERVALLDLRVGERQDGARRVAPPAGRATRRPAGLELARWQTMRVGVRAACPGCSHGVVRSRICLAYQGVFRYDQTITVTSRRTPSTSWRYQSGKVSLSPLVKSTPYGSTDLRRLYAQSRAA